MFFVTPNSNCKNRVINFENETITIVRIRKITLRFKGRELGHKELGMKIINKIKLDTKEIASIEQHPKMFGRQLIMVLNPMN